MTKEEMKQCVQEISYALDFAGGHRQYVAEVLKATIIARSIDKLAEAIENFAEESRLDDVL